MKADVNLGLVLVSMTFVVSWTGIDSDLKSSSLSGTHHRPSILEGATQNIQVDFQVVRTNSQVQSDSVVYKKLHTYYQRVEQHTNR